MLSSMYAKSWPVLTALSPMPTRAQFVRIRRERNAAISPGDQGTGRWPARRAAQPAAATSARASALSWRIWSMSASTESNRTIPRSLAAKSTATCTP